MVQGAETSYKCEDLKEDRTMRTRAFVAFLAVMLIVLWSGINTASAQTKAKTYSFKVASAWESTHPNNVPLTHLMNSVNEKCKTKDGNLEMKWVGGPETFKAQDLPIVCRAGSIDLFHSSNLYYSGVVPQSDYSSLPYGWSFENASKMWHSGIGDLADKAWQKQGLKVLNFESLLSMYFFFTKPVSKLSDFQGKKLRVPGGILSYLPGHVGAVSTPLASSEVYGAMQHGTIDGGIQPIVSYVAYSYWEVAPYIVNHPMVTSAAWYWTSLKKFNDLPKSLQEKLVEIALAEEVYAVGYWKEKEDEWVKTVREHKGKFDPLPPEEDKKLVSCLMKLKDNLGAKIPPEESKTLFAIYDKFAK